jgi:hypothetical protein
MSAGGGVQRIKLTERETPVFGGAEFAAVGSGIETPSLVYVLEEPAERLCLVLRNLALSFAGE